MSNKKYLDMSQPERNAYRNQRIEEERIFYKDLFQNLRISPKEFTLKTIFRNSDKVDCVGLYPNEFTFPNGLYFEVVDRNTLDTLENRIVYRLAPKYGNSYEEEFEMSSAGSYLVPIEEARIVNVESFAISKENAYASYEDIVPSKPITKQETSTYAPIIGTRHLNQATSKKMTNAPIIDAPFSEMTIRDYVAIKTGLPVSEKAWLNEILKNK